MPGPQTLKELMQAGDLTMGEARRLASLVFDGMTVVDQNVVPYKVTMPLFETLAAHVQQFIVKAMLDATTVNLLDAATDPEEVIADLLSLNVTEEDDNID